MNVPYSGGWQSLHRVSARHSTGVDVVGDFSCVNVSWMTDDRQLLYTALTSYVDKDVYIFSQQLPDGAHQTNASNPVSSPSLPLLTDRAHHGSIFAPLLLPHYAAVVSLLLLSRCCCLTAVVSLRCCCLTATAVVSLHSVAFSPHCTVGHHILLLSHSPTIVSPQLAIVTPHLTACSLHRAAYSPHCTASTIQPKSACCIPLLPQYNPSVPGTSHCNSIQPKSACYIPLQLSIYF